jgi:hexosaminidase
MSKNVTVLFICAFVAACAQDLMPLPASMSPAGGKLAIDSSFRVALEGYREPRIESAAVRLVSRLALETGIPITGGVSGNGAAELVIDCKGPGEQIQTPGEDESYSLEVSPHQARIAAATPVGALRGVETFLQLVAPQPGGFAAPAVRIEDKPRFRWRGLLIDSCRHFIPLDVIERNLDAMAAVKLNVLHWHLSDDQGFRVESKRYPKLQEAGSDGLYYSEDQIRHVIEFARDRGIRIVPEFDMPGHSTAWFVGYPRLASAPGPYRIERAFGIFDPTMDPTREETYEFLAGFIAEMAELFPDPYFHIGGGDEVNGKQWDSNPRIQEFKRVHGFKTNPELQAYFNKRLLAIVTKNGKKMVVWDEALASDLSKDVLVETWRSQGSLAASARQGYQGLLSFGYYLNRMQPAAYHYGIDPLGGDAAKLNDAEKARILGGEACEWTELVSAENFEARVWPGLAAVAERFWSPQSTTDVNSMYRRMEIESGRLEWLGLKHRSSSRVMLERIVGYRPAAAITALSTALEPAGLNARDEARPYTQWTPLNRMVDATPGESVTAREFSLAVDALLRGDRDKLEDIRRQSILWRDQHGQLKQAFEDSFLAAEVEPVSAAVSALGGAAIEALDYIAAGKSAPQSWVAAQSGVLERAKTPKAELRVVIAGPVRKLVEAAAR